MTAHTPTPAPLTPAEEREIQLVQAEYARRMAHEDAKQHYYSATRYEVEHRLHCLRAPCSAMNPIGAPPMPREWTNDKRCDCCKLGDHDKCFAAMCYGCKDESHDRGTRGMGINAGSHRALGEIPGHVAVVPDHHQFKVRTFGQDSHGRAAAAS